MKKDSRRRREQQRPRAELPPEEEQSFTLEDILNEFGGWSARSEPAAPPPAPAESTPAAEETPEAAPVDDAPEERAGTAAETEEEPPAPDREERPSHFRFIRLDGRPIDAPADAGSEEETEEAPAEEDTSPIWSYHPDPSDPAAARTPERVQAAAAPAPEPKKTRKERRGAERETKPELPRRPAAEVYKGVCRRTKGLRLRKRVMTVWCAAAVVLTTLCHFRVSLGGFVLGVPLTAQVLMALLLLGALTAYDVLIGGVYQLLRLRPDLETLLLVSTVAFAVEGFLHMSGESAALPKTGLLLLGLWFALWGRVLGNRARRRSLKTVLGMDEHPIAAVLSPRAWGSRDCVFRSEGDRDELAAALDEPSVVDRAMALYAPLVIGLSLVLALVMHFLRGRSFLPAWTAMLAGSLPLAAFVTYWRPFAATAARLCRSGAALCGWRGAKELSGPLCVAVYDGDLFAKANVTMNGMKVFHEYNVSQIAGYTYSVIAESGSGLEPVFQEVLANQNGRKYQLGGFRRYEGGGVGAEIQGDLVLVGSIGFMRVMGVRMPEGTNVRQAVYCAVNGELAAVFALHYNPSAVVRTGLQTVLRSKGVSLLLATRDFILTPAMVRHKYKVPSEVMEYPSVEERVRLSGPYAAAGGRQTALLGRDSFLPLSETVASGRALSSSVRSGLAVNLLGGCLGFAIAAILAWLGGLATASSFNLMLFGILWTLPSLLLTTSTAK